MREKGGKVSRLFPEIPMFNFLRTLRLQTRKQHLRGEAVTRAGTHACLKQSLAVCVERDEAREETVHQRVREGGVECLYGTRGAQPHLRVRAVWCAVAWSGVEWSGVQCGAVRSSAVQWSGVECGAVRCGAVRCGARHCTLHCTTLLRTAVHCNAVRYSAVQGLEGEVGRCPWCASRRNAMRCGAMRCGAM